MSTELIIALIKSGIALSVLLTNTILLIWLERKIVAGMQGLSSVIATMKDKCTELEWDPTGGPIEQAAQNFEQARQKLMEKPLKNGPGGMPLQPGIS